jgi:hypothetical protein
VSKIAGISDDETRIRLSKAAGERLGPLTSEQGTTGRGPVDEFAAERFTGAELKERGEKAREYLREHMGIELTEADHENGRRLLGSIEARSGRYRGADS